MVADPVYKSVAIVNTTHAMRKEAIFPPHLLHQVGHLWLYQYFQNQTVGRSPLFKTAVLLEIDTSRKLQAAPSAHTIHTPLSAAKRARYGAEAAVRRRAAVIAGWIGELRRVAQLEGIEPELPRGFTEDREASEDGDVVLDVTRSPELVSSRGAHANILRCAT